MSNKLIIGIVFLLAISLLAGSGIAKTVKAPYGCTSADGTCECDVKVIGARYYATPTAGNNVDITVSYELTAGAGDTCIFLLEASIQPTIPPTLSIQHTASNPICCPANKNFAATKVSVAGGWWDSITELHSVTFNLQAPTPNSQDNCYTGDQKRTYWDGEGSRYTVVLAGFNGCQYEVGANLVTLAWDKTHKISVMLPAECGDGNCVTGETKENCPQDCVPECKQPGCQDTEAEKMYCPAQCPIIEPQCNIENCPGPFFQCVGNSCQFNWTIIIGIIVLVVVISGVVYAIKRK